ncbi:MAG: hypothetical protein IKX76_05270 [Eubacterium sp.]|nr:hypothetical protein [Eubacterium sp.]
MIYCLINPSSRSRRNNRIWKGIERDLKEEGTPYQLIFSKSGEDVRQIAGRLTSDDEEKTVIILGGDGTLNSFLNGMQTTRGIKIGYLPMGSGNDFARGMGITTNYKEEMDLILHDKQIRKLHYGTVIYKSGRSHRFFVSAGLGYDAKVCYVAEHSRMKKLFNLFGMGRIIYLFIGIRSLLTARTFSAALYVDGVPVLQGDRFLFTSFHMLPYEGGGFKFCPDVRPEDSQVGICAVEGISKRKIPFIIPQALVGTHVSRKGVYQYRCSKAEFIASEPQYVHTDGETDYLYDRVTIHVSEEKVTFLN